MRSSLQTKCDREKHISRSGKIERGVQEPDEDPAKNDARPQHHRNARDELSARRLVGHCRLAVNRVKTMARTRKNILRSNAQFR